MAEETFQHIPWLVSQSRNRQTSSNFSSTASVPSLAIEAKTTTSTKPLSPSRLSPLSKTTPISPTEKPRGIVKRTSKTGSLGSRDASSRFTTGTMNELASEVTYTPTTHRISKAKKGKKVHACEYPGCPKIFTRAEHRKRHEANHNTEPLYQCCVEDCRKPFQRSDLLARHMERQHNMPAEASLPRTSRSQRSASVPSNADSNPSNTGLASATMPHPPAIRGQTLPMAQPAAQMSIGSIIEPSRGNDFGQRFPNDLSHLAVGVGPRTLPTAEMLYGTIPGNAESPMYSSDSCYSPMSDYLQQPQVSTGQRYMSHDAVSPAQPSRLESFYQPQLMTSPLSVSSAFPVWDQFDPSVLATPLEEGSYLPTVAESPLFVPFSYMDWGSLRHQFIPSAAMAMDGQGHLLNQSRYKYFLDCYWRDFHPFFPIIHHSALALTPPPPLLALMMVTIGAMISSNPATSVTFYKSCVEFFTTRHHEITNNSPLSDMQTVILLEAISRYLSGEARCENMTTSSRFQTLYSSLLQDEELLQHDRASVFTNLPFNVTANALGQAKELWTRHETKRRILLAAFVLDTQISVFFEQPAFNLDLVNMNLPYPQPTQTWECPDLGKWRSLVPDGHRPDLRLLGHDFSSLAPFDAFQSSFISCYQIHRGYLRRGTNMSRYGEIVPCLPETPIHRTTAFLTYVALQLSSLAPVKSLLIVSSASWLFGTKVTEPSVWESAKVKLRAWVATDAAARCTSYATQVLQIFLENQSLEMPHGKWCTYLAALVCWAYGFSPGQHEVPGRLNVDMANFQAREYLLAMNGSTSMEISGLSMRWYTRGVLECVRARLRGSMGGVLNQAEDTLAALAEGRSQLMNF